LAAHLEGDVALEAGIAGAIHLAHAAFAKLRHDLVRANAPPDHVMCREDKPF
jgi:hypothetical protein